MIHLDYRRLRAPAILWLTSVILFSAGCATHSRADDATPSPVGTLPAPTVQPIPSPTEEPASAYPRGEIGYAISSPQCDGHFPKPPFDFLIVGVNAGRALTKNPCFAEEWRLALSARHPPSVYTNLNLYDCETITNCDAYQYGRLEAAFSYKYAEENSARPLTWWLDIQIVSDWSQDLARNAASIRGAIDYLHEKGARVGISSTWFQWASIAGIDETGLPIWDAGARSLGEAYLSCAAGKDFGGGRTEQIAYVEEFEIVLACEPQEDP